MGNGFNELNIKGLFSWEIEGLDGSSWQMCRGFLQGVKGIAVGLKTV
jgi:hypothetical protein